MKFGHLFEFHKIPEWYTEYVDYKELRALIDDFKLLNKVEKVKKLKGYYMINDKGQLYCIDFIKNYKEDLKSIGSNSPKFKVSRVAESDETMKRPRSLSDTKHAVEQRKITQPSSSGQMIFEVEKI